MATGPDWNFETGKIVQLGYLPTTLKFWANSERGEGVFFFFLLPSWKGGQPRAAWCGLVGNCWPEWCQVGNI